MRALDLGTMIWLCAVWLACATALLLSYIRRGRPKSPEAMRRSASMLILMSAVVLSRVADLLSWPRYVELAFDGLVVLLAAGNVVWLISGWPLRHPRYWIKDPPSLRR